MRDKEAAADWSDKSKSWRKVLVGTSLGDILPCSMLPRARSQSSRARNTLKLYVTAGPPFRPACTRTVPQTNCDACKNQADRRRDGSSGSRPGR